MLGSDRLVVVGDIGGTHMRFAVADRDEFRIDHYVQFRCADFSSIEHGLSAYLQSIPNYPRRICLAVAGPVDGDTVHMSNLPWDTSLQSIRSVAQTNDTLLVNDFEALALALPILSGHDIHQIGGGKPVPHACKAVIGPGTGLGVGAIIDCEAGPVAVSGEGGHATFAPQTADEYGIFDRLRLSRHHVSYEHVLSGQGLVSIYAILREMQGLARTALSPAEIVAAAHEGEDAQAVQTLDYFVTWLGRFAGDMALIFGARGGLYLAGGIPPKILGDLDRGGFRATFEHKGRLSSYIETVPVFVVKAADAGLIGAAVAYSNRSKTRKADKAP